MSGGTHQITNRKYSPEISSARRMWLANYRELSFEFFFENSKKNCYYCDVAPSNNYNGNFSIYQKSLGDFIYNGLDRLDSSKGHTEDNVVPCCWICNKMKNNLSFDDFIKHIELLYLGTQKFRT